MNHFVFDSYSDLSIPEGEIISRDAECIAVDLAAMDQSVPIPDQLDTFWASNLNKQNLQLLARHVGSEWDLQDVMMSDFVILMKILFLQDWNRQGHIQHCRPTRDVPLLNNWQEEADSRVISHVKWEIKDGWKSSCDFNWWRYHCTATLQLWWISCPVWCEPLYGRAIHRAGMVRCQKQTKLWNICLVDTWG